VTNLNLAGLAIGPPLAGPAAAPKAATPTISPSSETVASYPLVTLACSTAGSSLYYTEDGSPPTYPPTGSTEAYGGPFTPSGTSPLTVTALAVAPSYAPSSFASATYTLTATRVATPAVVPSSQTVAAYPSTTITCATAGASLYYTQDGSTPTTGSTSYTGAFTPAGASPLTVNALGVKAGLTNSLVGSATYTISSGSMVLYANGSLGGMWAVGLDLSFGSVNYTYTGNPNTPDTESILVGTGAGLQHGSNWPPFYQGGTNGYDTSPYTWIEFDLANTGGAQFQVSGHYLRGDVQNGADLAICTGVGNLANVPGIGAVTTTWTKGYKLARCFIGQLGDYNHYKEDFQTSGGAMQLDNIKYLAGNLTWIYRGNTSLEAGWSDSASTGVAANYSYLPQTTGASLYAINAPPRAAANFTATITGYSGGSATLNVTALNATNPGGPIAVGDHLYYGPNVSGNGAPTGCFINAFLSGAGGTGTYTVSGANGNAASQGMMSVQDQRNVCAAALTTSAGAQWRVTYAGGFSTNGLGYLTFAVIPLKAGGANNYTLTAYNTAGTALGSVAISAGSLTYTCQDFGHNTSNFTVYLVPLTALGVSSGATVGAFGLKDTNGVNPLVSAVALFS
jgi:hypothetical protein